MPRGPKGEKRPADAIGNAIMVAKIATGEIEDTVSDKARVRAGTKGGAARARHMTPEQRAEAAKLAAQARWRKKG